MFKWVLFVVFPVLELMLIIWLSQLVGWAVVALFVLGKMILGAMLLNRLGGESIQRMAMALKMGSQLGFSMQVAALRLCAALLLLFPGVFSGLMAIPFVVSPIQRVMLAWLGKHARFFSEGAPRPIQHSSNQDSANDEKL